MKKTLLAIALCCSPLLASAAQTPVTNIGAFASPSTASINTLKAAVNTKLDVIELDRQDHVANIATKADKAQAVRYWGDHADGTTLASGTMVAHDGKIYHTKQNFLKTAGATPNTFTEYFEVAGGSNDYNSLSNRPPLGTAAALNVGTSANNIVQLNSSGDLPAVSGANLTNLPSASLPSWLPSVAPTNGRQIMQATGGCSVETYDTQATCEANAGTWTTPVYVNTSIISGLINDAGTAADDLWSAAKITSELAGKQAADSDLTTWAGVTPGTGVASMLTIAPGSAGGVTTTIASGTVELNTTTVANSGVIASGASQLLATHITATGALAASDGVDWYFIGDHVAKTGFAPLETGMLTLVPFVDADGFVQIRVSNNTASSITLNTAGNGQTIKWAVRR